MPAVIVLLSLMLYQPFRIGGMGLIVGGIALFYSTRA
jgi:hypothetical protein